MAKVPGNEGDKRNAVLLLAPALLVLALAIVAIVAATYGKRERAVAPDLGAAESTRVPGFDAFKANAIYSTDPDNSWTDSKNTTMFNWIFGVDLREDGNLWMAGCDHAPTGNTGLSRYDGETHTSYLLDKTCWRACNGSVGVSEGTQNQTKDDPDYPCSIYTYTTDGTLDLLTLQCSCRSMVRGMAYDHSRNRLFALFWVPLRGIFVLEGYPSA